MNHVPKSWLKWLNIGFLCFDIVLIMAFGLTHLMHIGPETAMQWALTPITAVMAGIQLVYGVTINPIIARRNPWFAAIIVQAFMNFTILTLIEVSGEVNLYWWILWISVVFASAMAGYFVIATEIMIEAVLLILTVLGLQTSGKSNTHVEFIYLCLSIAAALLGWLVFRRWFENSGEPNDQVSALNDLLRQEQLRSGLIIQSIADGVVVFDTTGRINIINAAAAAITGWPAKEAVGIDVRLVMKLVSEDGKPLPETDDIFNGVLARKQHLNQTLQIVGRHGKTSIISLVVSPIQTAANNDPVGAVAVFRDVTSERQEEKQRAEFISTASHEMRTPVAAIEGYLALALNDKVSTIDSKARSYLEKAHESTQHLGQLFQDLLTSARAEDGRLNSHPEVIETGTFLEQLTDNLRLVAAKKNLALEFVIGSNETIDATQTEAGIHIVKPLYYTYADPDRIREVITNLFDNAVKYTDSGKISIGLTGNDSVVQFYIRDTGPGIPAADIPHLFQKFYRVDSSATRTIGGTGLGLFICRKIIELYKGRIWVESEEGKGSTFFTNLPRLSAQKAEELKTAAAAQTTLPNISSLSSL